MVDLIVIGGGPAGCHGAINAATNGLKTVVISNGGVGGVCLHSGCIPSKTMLYSTELSRDHADFAIYGGPHLVDVPVLRERIGSIVSTLERGITQQFKRLGVTLLDEVAEILPKRDRYFAVKAGSEILMSRYLLIATGSRERALDIPGIDKVSAVTISDLIEHESAPESLLIVGAGAVGLEIGSAFARMGTQVTIIEKSDRIAPQFDSDLTRILAGELEKEGLKIHTSSVVERFHSHSADIRQNGKIITCRFEKVLFALGRSPRLDITGLLNLSVTITADNSLAVSSCGETSEPGCYAAGDVIGEPMLAHAAYYESEQAIANMLGKVRPTNNPCVPTVLYTYPELASIGLSEKDAAQQGIPVVVKRRPFGGNGRFLAETSGMRGVCKVLLHKETGVVLGIHLAVPHASELIAIGSLIISQKLTADDLAHCIFPHPTMGEIIKQCIVEEI